MKNEGVRRSNLGRRRRSRRWGCTGRRWRRQAAVAARWAGGELWLSWAMVLQIPCGLFLRDRSETMILFCLPSSDGGWHGERAVATSFARTRPMAWGFSSDPPTWLGPRVAPRWSPLAIPGDESAGAVTESNAQRIWGLKEFRSVLDEIRANACAIYRGFYTRSLVARTPTTF
jgi:hypothetical protein